MIDFLKDNFYIVLIPEPRAFCILSIYIPNLWFSKTECHYLAQISSNLVILLSLTLERVVGL